MTRDLCVIPPKELQGKGVFPTYVLGSRCFVSYEWDHGVGEIELWGGSPCLRLDMLEEKLMARPMAYDALVQECLAERQQDYENHLINQGRMAEEEKGNG